VVRYGNARGELCLGLAVTPQVDVSLDGLRKDNTGYDLRDLLWAGRHKASSLLPR
jgi:hypothetical protein